MSDISSLNALSLNHYQNAQLQKKYDKHVNKVLEIGDKKPNVKEIAEQQRKISAVLKKSKNISRSFKEKQFMAQRELENRRLMKSLSMIHNKAKMKTEQQQRRLQQRNRQLKQKRLREYEQEREDRVLSQNILARAGDVNKYKKRVERQIADYMRLKQHMQKLKPLTAKQHRPFHLKTEQPGEQGRYEFKGGSQAVRSTHKL